MIFDNVIYLDLIEQRLGRDTKYSRDIGHLEQFEYQLLFVPDIFMARHPLNSVIQPYCYTNKSLGAGFTAEDHWGFWKYKLGPASYPIAMVNHNRQNTSRNKVGRIKGEIYAVRPYMFIDLDNWYLNKVEFVRHRTNIILPYRKRITNHLGEFLSQEFTETLRCWMYVGRPDVWLDMLDGGFNFEPVSLYTPKSHPDKWESGPYFYWSLNEYSEQNNSTKPYSLSKLHK